MIRLLLLAGLAVTASCQKTAVSVYNTAPTATITDPADGVVVDAEGVVEFQGLVVDGQQDPPDLIVVWTSSLDGALGSNAEGEGQDLSLSPDSDGVVHLAVSELSPGIHAITLMALDDEGTSAEDVITVEVSYGGDGGGGDGGEGAPTVTLIGPLPDDEIPGDQILNVVGTATDDEQAWDTLRASILTSREGLIWEGSPASSGAITEGFKDLIPGLHEITLNVEDDDGNVGSDSVTITVLGDGSPEVEVLAPTNGSVWWNTDTLTLEGTAVDDVTASEGLSVEWESSLDGTLTTDLVDSDGYTAYGTGLSEGIHVITLYAWDEDDNEGSDSVSIEVVDPLNHDGDGDGWTENEGDCDDTVDTTYPGAYEICDDVDNDCDDLNNEDWWDDYDAVTGADNDSDAAAHDLDEVDSSWLWAGESLELSGLTIHDVTDEDWFIFDVDDEIWDPANFTVRIVGLDTAATWGLELYNVSAGMTLEQSVSGSASLLVGHSDDIIETFDDDDDVWAVRIYVTSWDGGSICESVYSLEIEA